MKRVALVVSLVGVAGCTKNHAELKATQAILDRQLADQMERADNLNTLRKEIDDLEQKVADGLSTTPEAKAEIDALIAKTPTAPIGPAFPPLPPESAFEGAEGTRLRARILDTEARISQLGKVLGEIHKIEGRKERLTQALKVLEERRAKEP